MPCYYSPVNTPVQMVTIGWPWTIALLAGIPSLSVIGVWLLARFTKVFDAYAGERAKLQVQFDNVARLVEQTQKLTEATEIIKTRLSDEVWTKQQRWLKRFDAYTEVLEELDGYRSATALFINAITIQAEFHGHDDAARNKITAYYDDAVEQHNKACASWIHAGAIAHLACHGDATAIVDRIMFRPRGTEVTVQSLTETHGVLSEASTQFAKVARLDLGYEPI